VQLATTGGAINNRHDQPRHQRRSGSTATIFLRRPRQASRLNRHRGPPLLGPSQRNAGRFSPTLSTVTADCTFFFPRGPFFPQKPRRTNLFKELFSPTPSLAVSPGLTPPNSLQRDAPPPADPTTSPAAPNGQKFFNRPPLGRSLPRFHRFAVDEILPPPDRHSTFSIDRAGQTPPSRWAMACVQRCQSTSRNGNRSPRAPLSRARPGQKPFLQQQGNRPQKPRPAAFCRSSASRPARRRETSLAADPPLCQPECNAFLQRPRGKQFLRACPAVRGPAYSGGPLITPAPRSGRPLQPRKQRIGKRGMV